MKISSRKLYSKIKKRINNFFYIIIGWIIIVPLAKIIPKKKKSFSFIGRDKGLFLDNVKYLYLYFYSQDLNENKNQFSFFFITEDSLTYNLLKKSNLSVYLYPSFKAIWNSLRAEYLIVDNMMWISNLKYFLFYGAKRVQLWHGVAFKRIYLDEPKFLKLSKRARLFFKLIGYEQTFYLVISTSSFYTNKLFKKAFKCKNIIETGYPRNDILKNSKKYGKLQFINTDIETINYVKKMREKKYKVIIYMPTFRDSQRNFLDYFNLKKLNDFAASKNFIFVLKLHPDTKIKEKKSFENILFYDSSKDIYPMLPLSDLLITDYSSIYTDYLFLGKPIIFFPFDKKEYSQMDREFQFDYEEMTPGPKAFTQNELEEAIVNILKKDIYETKRKEILKLAFTYNDENSSERIFNYLIKK